MSCPYSEEELERYGVCNPMGSACSDCGECECEHWVGSCEDCDRVDPGRFVLDEEYAGLFRNG